MSTALDSAAAPNPLVREMGFWLVFPYLLDLGPGDFEGYQRAFARLGARLSTGEALPPPGGGGVAMRQDMPGSLDAEGELDRWFIREVSALLRASSRRPEERGRTKFVFASFESGGGPLERGYRLALLRAPKPREGLAEGAAVADVFEHVRLEVFAVLSQAGALMLFVHARLETPQGEGARPELSLKDAMALTYYASLSQIYTTNTFLALVPEAAIERSSGAEVGAKSAVRQGVVLSAEALSGCMHLHPDPRAAGQADKEAYGPVRLSLAQIPRSLPDLLRARLMAELGEHPVYVATKGKIPVVSLYVIDRATLPDGTTQASLEAIEGLAARCLRHPLSSAIVPLPLRDLEAEELQVYRVSGSQTLYVSCEGMCAFGSNATQFDERFWPQRVGSEYLMTFVLVLHQALICQDISWKSYTDANRARDEGGTWARGTEALVKQFHEFNTDYNFSVVSHQYNVQRLYRCARVALGVERTIAGIHAELLAWLEASSREEQQALNSLAALSILVSSAALFASCNLNEFNKDARLSLVHAVTGKPPPPEDADRTISALPWFLLPSLLVLGFVAVMARRGTLGRHVKRLRRLFLGP